MLHCISNVLLGSTCSFLCLTNVSLYYRYVYFRSSILLCTFVVFQVECVWCLLSTTCTVKSRKPLLSLLFHCQWNHCNCMAPILMHCPFKASWLCVVFKKWWSYFVAPTPSFLYNLVILANMWPDLPKGVLYTYRFKRHSFYRHLLTTSMHQQDICLLLLKVEQSAFTQALFSSLSGIHECSGSL